MALHAKVYGYDYNTYVILGDGDFQEGMVWEAFLTIPKITIASKWMDAPMTLTN
jgi:transketolase N-terminal domain/subunit